MAVGAQKKGWSAKYRLLIWGVSAVIVQVLLCLGWFVAASWIGSAEQSRKAAYERLTHYLAAERSAAVLAASDIRLHIPEPKLDRAREAAESLRVALQTLVTIDTHLERAPKIGAAVSRHRRAMKDLKEFVALLDGSSMGRLERFAAASLATSADSAWRDIAQEVSQLRLEASAFTQSAETFVEHRRQVVTYVAAAGLALSLVSCLLLVRRAFDLLAGLKKLRAAAMMIERSRERFAQARPVIQSYGSEFADIADQLDQSAERLSEIEQARLALEDSKNSDPETGAPNRRALLLRMESLAKEGGPWAALHVDLNRFRDVNERFGREDADKVLREIVATVREKSDGHFFARISGDEFVILVEAESSVTDLEQVAAAAQSAIREAGQKMADELGEPSLSVTGSVGIAIRSEEMTGDRLLSDAELAAQHAKRNGRGNVAFCSPTLRQKTAMRDAFARDLARAIADDEIEPFFQPQVSLATGELVGLEAFARWRHPTKGVLPPAVIFASDEDGVDLSDLLDEVDDVIAKKSLEALGVLGGAGWRPPFVSVNVSGRRLENPRFIDRLGWLLEETGETPDRLRLEVNAKAISESEVQERMAARLLDMGFHIDLDDFARGGRDEAKRAMQVLRRLKLDRVKLDRVMVADINEHAQKRKVVAAIINAVTALGVGVVAEGVERVAERDVLQDLDCDVAQGHLYAVPMPVDELYTWLSEIGVLHGAA